MIFKFNDDFCPKNLHSSAKKMTKTQKIFLFLLFGIACYFPLFLRLDFIGLELWDEARRGVNALEMLINGNWLVTHYDGQPEMWGTKPPFLIWCQVLCMKSLGINELAIRLPSALAALATVVVLILFSHRRCGKIVICSCFFAIIYCQFPSGKLIFYT